ncbi:MAG TPA: hypothetical protein VFU15_02490 [Bacteroidia bacterium]|nr:hypothetical protein [Bacteroidia bacterium]
MRYLLFTMALLLLLCRVSRAQIGLRVFNYRPTGELGFVMKPLFSAELSCIAPFEDGRWRTQFSLTYLRLKPRMDTFPVYGVVSSGSTGTTVYPGTQSFQKYSIVQLSGGGDFAFIDKDPFYVFAGADIVVGGASVEYTSQVQTIKDESYSGGGILAGFRFRLGAEYDVNDQVGIIASANRNYLFISEPAGLYGANDYGIGLRYSFH